MHQPISVGGTLRFLKSAVWPASWQFFSRCFIMLGLPLIGWGLADLAGFFSNPIRVAIAMIVLVLALAQAWMLYVTPRQPNEAKAEARSTGLKWHATLFETILILAAFGDRRDILTWNENQPVRWVGSGIYLLGTVLSIWAGLTRPSFLYSPPNPFASLCAADKT